MPRFSQLSLLDDFLRIQFERLDCIGCTIVGVADLAASMM